jgi:hypothetical protein
MGQLRHVRSCEITVFIPVEASFMSAKRRFLSGLLLIVGLVLAAYGKWQAARDFTPLAGGRAILGRQLPVFPVTDDSGKDVDLAAAVLGKRSIIAFYSASCSSCRRTLPELNPLPPNLNLVLVNEEAGSSVDIRTVPGFDKAWLFHDRSRVLARALPLAAIPTILFVDEAGILRDGLMGRQAPGSIRSKLARFAETGS